MSKADDAMQALHDFYCNYVDVEISITTDTIKGEMVFEAALYPLKFGKRDLMNSKVSYAHSDPSDAILEVIRFYCEQEEGKVSE